MLPARIDCYVASERIRAADKKCGFRGLLLPSAPTLAESGRTRFVAADYQTGREVRPPWAAIRRVHPEGKSEPRAARMLHKSSANSQPQFPEIQSPFRLPRPPAGARLVKWGRCRHIPE